MRHEGPSPARHLLRVEEVDHVLVVGEHDGGHVADVEAEDVAVVTLHLGQLLPRVGAQEPAVACNVV